MTKGEGGEEEGAVRIFCSEKREGVEEGARRWERGKLPCKRVLLLKDFAKGQKIFQ